MSLNPPNELRADVWSAFRACRLWRTASDERVAELARKSRVETVSRGTVLATEGDPAEEFGLVVIGSVRVFHLGADGRQITYESLQAGDPFGAVASLAGGRYPAHVESATDAVIARIPAEALFELMEAEAGVARVLVTHLANQVVNFTSVVQTLALDVPSRLARYIFQRSLQGGQPTATGLVVDLGMKKGELAMALGTVPETLSRAFAKLKDDGLLEVSGSKVTVLDVRALASLGSGYGDE